MFLVLIGTLTANKMTARALFAGKENYLVSDPSVLLADYIKKHNGGLHSGIIELICYTISIDSMNETVLHYAAGGDKGNKIVDGGSGNPTEVALLQLVHELGYSYENIRNQTRGRSEQGALGAFLAEGKQFGFTSARKIMSWAVPLAGGGYRVYMKGAAEVVLSRCSMMLNAINEAEALTDTDRGDVIDVCSAFARRGMRCLALAYRDLPSGFDLEETTDSVKNSDGSPANTAETDMIALACVGIEDPLRPEVPGAIEKCYQAGIDVRMVTGDSPNTAVSIAYQAGIIRDFHFLEGTNERVALNLKENVLMEGKIFRAKFGHIFEFSPEVHRMTS
jgi:P-type Ca2+ transporter type 2B